MTEAAPTKSIVVERLMTQPPARVWRALTQSAMIESWLMKNDFEPVVGHEFTFRATPVPGWSGVTNCKVLAVEPHTKLAYSWGNGTESDSGLQTVVTWTIEETPEGCRVRMEHSGFRPQDEGGYKGMGGGWPRIVERLGQVAASA